MTELLLLLSSLKPDASDGKTPGASGAHSSCSEHALKSAFVRPQVTEYAVLMNDTHTEEGDKDSDQ